MAKRASLGDTPPSVKRFGSDDSTYSELDEDDAGYIRVAVRLRTLDPMWYSETKDCTRAQKYQHFNGKVCVGEERKRVEI